MSSVTLYGIKNCDTVKKARQWLDDHSVPYIFHDFRVDGINNTLINNILKQIDIEILINKRGTSWRKLSDKEKNIKNKRVLEIIKLDMDFTKRVLKELK